MSWVAPLPSFSSSPGIPSNHRLICREGDQPNILWISQELVEYLQDSGCNFCEHFGMSKRIGQLLKLKQKTSDICAVVFFYPSFDAYFFWFSCFFQLWTSTSCLLSTSEWFCAHWCFSSKFMWQNRSMPSGSTLSWVSFHGFHLSR